MTIFTPTRQTDGHTNKQWNRQTFRYFTLYKDAAQSMGHKVNSMILNCDDDNDDDVANDVAQWVLSKSN